ncbi:MAG TPA: hypothetical protein VIG24_13030 [Acidimicrobiia bacterium]
MLIKITFDPRDDLSQEYKDRIEGLVILATEAETANWTFGRPGYRCSWVLTFRTERPLADVVDGFESEGFYLDEFVEFAALGKR